MPYRRVLHTGYVCNRPAEVIVTTCGPPTFTFTGTGDFTTPGNWSPSYPGTTIPSGTVINIGAGAVCTISGPISNAGTINNAGTVINNSTITNTGTFSHTGTYKGTGTFNGSVFTNGGTVAPGASPGCTVFGAGYTNGGGTEVIELGGTTVCSGYDQLQVTGTATLSGTLDVQLFGGFTPVLGNSFTIMTSTTISGTYATVILPSLGGSLGWDLQYNFPSTGDITLTVITAPVHNITLNTYHATIQAGVPQHQAT